MEELEVAYIAGIFDGEGSVDYAQRMEKKKKTRPTAYLTWRIRCEVSMTNKDVMEWIHKKVGVGSLNLNIKNKSPSSKPHWKDQWRWRCTHRDALKFAKMIIPYAKVKKEKLQQIIKHYETSL